MGRVAKSVADGVAITPRLAVVLMPDPAVAKSDAVAAMLAVVGRVAKSVALGVAVILLAAVVNCSVATTADGAAMTGTTLAAVETVMDPVVEMPAVAVRGSAGCIAVLVIAAAGVAVTGSSADTTTVLEIDALGVSVIDKEPDMTAVLLTSPVGVAVTTVGLAAASSL